MEKERLEEILERHMKWLRGETGGERADLTGADLTGAHLTEADLTRADLTGAKNIVYPIACPDSGAFIGWKKARLTDDTFCVVKLNICEDAKRSSATSRKCRCSKALVLEVQNMDGDILQDTYAVSDRDADFKYIPGKIVSVADFDENRWQECSTGIHFFVTREEAVRHEL